MPNWTRNEVKLWGDKELLDRIVAECFTDGCLDFAKVVPYPEGFDPDLPSGSYDEAYALWYDPNSSKAQRMFRYEWVIAAGVSNIDQLRELQSKRYVESGYDTELKAKYPTLKDLADAYKRNMDTSGCQTWYDWNTGHWGTKWPACDGSSTRPSDEYLKVEFNTAWCEPREVFDALHEKYPQLEMRYVSDHEGGEDITGHHYYPEDPEDPEEA